MAYDREHGILVWGGVLPGGEQWTNSLRIAETEETIGANDAAGWDMTALLNHYYAKLFEHHQNPSAFISSRCSLAWVKFNRLDINGHYIDDTTYRKDFTSIGGGGGGTGYPNQIALVVTLTTAVARGPANKGRIFAPMPTCAVDASDGLISLANATALATAYRQLIENLSDVPGVDTSSTPGVCVMSKVGTGVRTRRVSGVRIGRVLDTQRRRRNGLAEDYQVQAVDQGAY